MNADMIVTAMSEESTLPKGGPGVGCLRIAAYFHKEDLESGCPQKLVRCRPDRLIEAFDPEMDKWVNTTSIDHVRIERLIDGSNQLWFRVEAEVVFVFCGMWHTMRLQPPAAKEVLSLLK